MYGATKITPDSKLSGLTSVTIFQRSKFQVRRRRLLAPRSGNFSRQERVRPLQQRHQDRQLDRNPEDQDPETEIVFVPEPLHVRRRHPGHVRRGGRLVAERHVRAERGQQHLRRRRRLGRRGPGLNLLIEGQLQDEPGACTIKIYGLWKRRKLRRNVSNNFLRNHFF